MFLYAELMKVKVCFIFALFLTITNGFCQSIFDSIYYSNNEGRANAVISVNEGGYVMAGSNANYSIMSISKHSQNGDTLWTKSMVLGIGAGNYINSAIETNDSNYVLGGTSGDPVLLHSHADLIKINKNTGDTIWVRKIGLPNRSERCYSVKQTSDNGFVLCGIRINQDSLGNITDEDVYLVKTDSMGIPQWERTYGGTNSDFGQSIEITAEGGYMILGYTYSYGIGQYNMYLIKTDSLGNMLWQKTYGGNLKDYGFSIAKTNDGNYVLAGGTYISTDTVAAYIVKIDTAGIVQWEKRYKGNYKYAGFNAVKVLQNGDIAVSGGLVTRPNNIRNYGQLKILNPNDGSSIWSKEYKYFDADSTQQEFYAMDLYNDGGFVMAGMAVDLRANANPAYSMWLVKTDCMGNDSIWDSVNCSLPVGVSEVVAKDINDVLVYPNPATNQFTIENSQLRINSIHIYNVLGELVLERIANSEKVIDVSSWNDGVYFVEVETEKGVVRRKVVKE